MKEAILFDKLNNLKVRCNLCNHRCIIPPDSFGICMVRQNKQGTLYSLVYDKIVAQHIDPIEKKPLFHYYPGSKSYSIATVGCNFRCKFCQNSNIAQMPVDKGMIVGDNISPEQIVNSAKKSGCKTISYTYTEPTIYYELAMETGKLAHKEGIKNIFVSNGYMTKQAVDMSADWLDAANIDLKAYNDKFYKEICNSKLDFVLDTLKNMKSAGIFIEITTLLVPELNDDKKELQKISSFIVNNLGPETPWHISRYHPTYKMLDRNSTPVKSLQLAREIGIKTGLRYVFTGNVPGDDGESTFCYKCGYPVIKRFGFSIDSYEIKSGNCPKCGVKIDVIE